MSDETTDETGEGKFPTSAGPAPGGRRKKRDPLPGNESNGGGAPPAGTGAPLDTFADEQPSADADPDGLSVTEKTTRPPAKLWGLRVSASHHDTVTGMIDALAAHTRLDKRQVGELVIQFLVQHRLKLFQYVEGHGHINRIDLDWFTQQTQQSDDAQ